MIATSGKLEELSLQPGNGGKEKRRVWNDRGRLKREALEKYQIRWLEDDYFLTVSKQEEKEEVHNTVMHTSMTESEHEFDLLRPIIPERSRIAELADTALPCYCLRTPCRQPLTELDPTPNKSG
ncbi:MAG: hypothetical protein Q9228_006148 [Teloschistes exilis]